MFTVGFPNIDVQGTEPKYTEGVISSLSGMDNNQRYFQISTPVQPGNSGGPLLNKEGSVVGIVISRLSAAYMLSISGTLPQNVNYATKSSFVQPFLETIPGINKQRDAWGKAPPYGAEKQNNGKTSERSALIEKTKAAVVLVLCY